jgi:hypothetical protein
MDGFVIERSELASIAIRLLEVIAEDLLELGLAAASPVDLVRPLDEALMQRHALALEQASVGGVTDQLMAEAVGVVVVLAVRADELLVRERDEVDRDHRSSRLIDEMLDGILREHEADHGCGFDHVALVGLEGVETRGQERVDAGRHDEVCRRIGDGPAVALAVQRPVVDEHRDHLLDEEGIAFRGPDDASHDLRVEPDPAEQLADHLAGVAGR